jgi:hypothetical protein
VLSRYRGQVGEYLRQKEQERLDRYKDRPWELQSKDSNGSAFLTMISVLAAALGAMALFSLF